jgi:hypothetical protein
MAVVALLSGKYHLSKRQVGEILEDLLGTDVSLGTVSNTAARVSEALAEPVEEARVFVQQQAVVHADETGPRTAYPPERLPSFNSVAARRSSATSDKQAAPSPPASTS